MRGVEGRGVEVEGGAVAAAVLTRVTQTDGGGVQSPAVLWLQSLVRGEDL